MPVNINDFPGCPVLNILCFQCRGYRFNPWLAGGEELRSLYVMQCSQNFKKQFIMFNQIRTVAQMQISLSKTFLYNLNFFAMFEYYFNNQRKLTKFFSFGKKYKNTMDLCIFQGDMTFFHILLIRKKIVLENNLLVYLQRLKCSYILTK